MSDAATTGATAPAPSAGLALHPCRNCGADAPAKFCPECGQKTQIHPPTTKEFFLELAGQYVAAEGKLWRTLVLLTLRPGRLTTEYLQGRRARYIIPLRLYLSASFLFFLTVKVLVPVSETNYPGVPEIPSKIQTEDADIERHGSHLTITPKNSAKGTKDDAVPNLAKGKEGVGEKAEETAKGAATGKAKDKEEAKAKDQDDDDEDRPVNVDLNFSDGKSFLECAKPEVQCARWKKMAARSALAFKTDPNAQKRRFQQRLEDNASYALFAMLPVFALLLALTYRSRRMFYGEHIVFSLHLHTFWFLAGLFIVLAPKDLADWMWFVIFGYGVWAMRQVYGGRWVPTILRAMTISAIYSFVVCMTTMILLIYLALT